MVKRWPLAFSLALLSVAQLTLVAASVGVVAYLSGRNSTLDLAMEFSNSITERVVTHLDQLLKTPVLINRLNQAAISSNRIQLNNKGQLEQLFWQQMQLFPVGYINYGGEDGSFVGLERLDNGNLLINLMGPEYGRRVQVVHAVRSGGLRGAEVERYGDMGEAKEEAWYSETVAATRPVWSSIYQWDDKPEVLSISHNLPIYGQQRQLVGVIGVDLILTQLSSFLAQIWGSQPGIVMILEPNGQLVASSSRGGALKRNAQGHWQRLNVQQAYPQLGEALTKSLKQLASKDGTNQAAANQLTVVDSPTSNPYFLNMRQWRDPEGLNWIITVLIPQSRFVGPFQQAFGVAFVMALAVLVASIVLNLTLLRLLLRPLGLLSKASERLNVALLRDPTETVAFNCTLPDSSPREFEILRANLNTLVNSFNQLLQRWRQSSEQLLQELEKIDRPSAQPPLSSPSANQPVTLRTVLDQVQSTWDQQRGPTTPPLQLMDTADLGELLIAEGSNLVPVLLDQLKRHQSPEQPLQGQLQLRCELQLTNSSRQVVFKLVGQLEIELLRLSLPA